MPLSQALNDIAEDMRRAAHQYARRRAARAAPRVALIVTTLIVPGSMILILVSILLGSDVTRQRPPRRLDGPWPSGSGRAVPEGAGGWLESACKLILAARAGVLLLTLISLTGEDDRDLVAILLVVAAAASFVPLRWWDRVGPALVRHPPYLAAELMLAALILLLTPASRARSSTSRSAPRCSAGCSTATRARAMFSLLLVAVYLLVARRARGGRRDPGHVPDLRRPARALPARRGGGRGRAAAARPPGGGGVRAGRGAEPARGGRGRARAARARHARLARQDGVRDRLRGARALAPDRARPGGRGRRGAPAGRGRAPGDAPGARDHRRAARGDGRVAAARLGARRRCAALGARRPASSSTSRSRRSASCTRRRARELEWILGEALANVQAPRARDRVGVRLRRLGRARRADGGRRRRRLRGARRPRRARRRAATSASAACASARCWPAATSASSPRRATAACCRSGCRRRSSPRVGVRAGTPGAPQAADARIAIASPPAPCPGYTWQ